MRKYWISLFLFLLAIPIIPFSLFGEIEGIRILENSSEYYVFIVGFLLLGSDILVPLPSSLVAVFIGTKLGVFFGSLSIFIGLMVGSIIGFGLGWFPGNALAKHLLPKEKQSNLEVLETRLSYWIILFSRSVPILAESTVIAAGLARLNPHKTLFIITFANFLLALLYATFGAWGQNSDSVTLLFTGGILIPVLGTAILLLLNHTFVKMTFYEKPK